MQITVNVSIDSDGSQQSYGRLNFSETAELRNAGFTTVSEVFTKVHALLNTLKAEHEAGQPKK
jgi:hypothetical protein